MKTTCVRDAFAPRPKGTFTFQKTLKEEKETSFPLSLFTSFPTAVYYSMCVVYAMDMAARICNYASLLAACEKWPQGLHTHYTNSDINLK